MTSKPTFSEADLVAMLSSYALGAVQDAQPLSAGKVQANYLIDTAQGRFVLKYYVNRSHESVRFEANLIDYLQRRDFPCAACSRNRQGRWVSTYQDKPYVVFEYIEGDHIEHPNHTQRSQIIHTAATLQTLTQHYKPYLRRFRWNYRPDLALSLAQDAAAQLGTDTARAKLDWFQMQVNGLQLLGSLPKGICHTDYHFSNMLFRKGELVALLDFDDANYTWLIFDLVNLIDHWAWPHEQDFNPDVAREIVRDYQRTRPLSGLEQRHLFDVHKLQILFDAVWFFARGEADDFYEKRKIEVLDDMGREGYYQALYT